MPLYSYECVACKVTTDEFRSVAHRNDCPKCECGGETVKIIAAYAAHSDLEPYYDWNLDAPIKSRQHRREVMKERGVSEKFGKGWK